MNNDIRLRVGARLKELRESRGLSLRQLSEQIGINHSNISAIETGKYNARLDTIEKFEVYFNVRFDILDVPEE